MALSPVTPETLAPIIYRECQPGSRIDIMQQRLTEAYKARMDQRPAMWRRPNFIAPDLIAQNPKARPKWHVFDKRQINPKNPYEMLYTALCGYSYSFDETDIDTVMLRGYIKTESIRCTKCDRMLNN